MGSFNTTCFLTGQTIAPRDRAYIFPIQQSIGYKNIEFKPNKLDINSAIQPYDSTCYSNAFWQSMGGMISCEYDDYGRFIVDQTKLNAGNIAKFLSTDFLTTIAGGNQFHDLPFDKNELDLSDPIAALDSVWDVMVHEGRVFTYKSYNRQPCKVGFAVVCAPAFDIAVENYGKLKDWDGNSLDIDSQVGRIMTALNFAWDTSSDIKVKCKNLLSDPEFKDCVTFDIADLSDEEIEKVISNIASYKVTNTIHEMFGSGAGYRFQHRIELNHIVESGKPEGERAKNVEAFIRACVAERSFFCYLEALNAKIQPIVYACQDYDNEIGRAYAKLVAETQKIVTANRNARD